MACCRFLSRGEGSREERREDRSSHSGDSPVVHFEEEGARLWLEDRGTQQPLELADQDVAIVGSHALELEQQVDVGSRLGAHVL